MDLFEYQGKELYRQYNIPTPASILIDNLESLKEVDSSHWRRPRRWWRPTRFNYPLVVKAQVQVGGRGKAGGIKVVNNQEEMMKASSKILGMKIKDHIVEKILIEEASEIEDEYYISFTLDRSKKQYLMLLSAKGGMDIEEVAKNNPNDLIKTYIPPSKGLDKETINQAISDSKLSTFLEDELQKMISSLYDLFTKGDCDLVEVNPLAIVKGGKVLALDSKITLDTNASFRHEEFTRFESEIPIPETEKIAKAKGLNFIKLDGTVGIIGNGAGLVMSTLDLVFLEGGSAANFLDIGGGAKAETVSAALEVLENDENVQSVLINIFGGITRCDLIAKGIVDATQGKSLPWKIIVRLDGTNSEEGRKILYENHHENIIVAKNMKEAAKVAVGA